jgi:hypothetical protein
MNKNHTSVIWCMVFIHRLLVLFCMCHLMYGFYSSFTDVVLYVSSDVWFLFIFYWCCPVCVVWCMVFIHRLLVLFCMCHLVYGFYSSFTDVVLYVSSDVWFLFIFYWCCPVCVIWCMVFIHRLLMLFCMFHLVYGFYSSFTGVVLYVSSGVWFKTIHQMTHTGQHQ